VSLKRKDLVSLASLSADEIVHILETAESFKEVSGREIKKVPALRGKTVVNLFFEPSTRTRTSFELAAKRLSADAINVSAGGSSLSKSETIGDMGRNLAAMSADVLVVRHGAAGVPHLLAEHVRLPGVDFRVMEVDYGAIGRAIEARGVELRELFVQ